MADEKRYINPDTPVFISYTGKDEELVKRFISLLDEKHIYHRDSITEDIDVISEFEREIGEGKVVVIFYSPAYFRSYHCMNEYKLIRNSEEGKKIYTVRCEDFVFDDNLIKYELTDLWGGRYARLKRANKFHELKPSEQAAYENYCYTDDSTKYCIYQLGSFFSDIKRKDIEALATQLNDLFLKKMTGGNLPSAILSKFKNNSFIPRDSDVKNVAELLDKKKVVNITGIGGCGKSTVSILYLVGTQDEKSQYKYGFQDRYSCITDIIVNNENVYKDFCETFVEERHVVEYVKQRAGDSQPDYYQTFLSILRYLNECTADNKPNLLVMDVNETANYAQVRIVIQKIVNNCKKWKLLVVSREMLCDDTQDYIDISRVDTIEFTFIKRLFLHYVDRKGLRSKCEAIDDNDLKIIFSKLGNLPVLIRALAEFWNEECTVSYILNYLGDYNLSPEIEALQVSSVNKEGVKNKEDVKNKEGVKEKIYDRIGNFLSLLCIFKNLPSELHKNIVRCMMLWKADYYPKKLIQKAVLGKSSMNPIFDQTLSDLENRCLLDSSRDKDSNKVFGYKMHGLIAQTCREQVLASKKTIIDSDTGREDVVDNPDYDFNASYRDFSDYIRNICSCVCDEKGFNDICVLIKDKGFLNLIEYKGFDDFYFSWLDSQSSYSTNIADNICDNPVINDYVNNMVFVKRGKNVSNDFYIGKTQVTQKLWLEVMGFNPSHFTPKNDSINSRYISDTSKFPVEQVSWFDCLAFIMRLNEMTHLKFRLPSESEWEYAAAWRKDGGCNKYGGCNDEIKLGMYAWFDDNSHNITHAVATKQSSELGIFDMSGNVWEWCQDDWHVSGSSRVLRGGSWYYSARDCRVSYRSSFYPDGRRNYFGLRLALVVP